MKTLWSIARLALVFVGCISIAVPVGATGIGDHRGKSEFDFSFPNNYGQFRNKIAGAGAHSDWLENLEDQIKKRGDKHQLSEHSIFEKYDDYLDAKENRHDDPLKFLFGNSGYKHHQDRFETFFENNPRYANYFVGFDGSKRELRLIAKKIIADHRSGAASVVPIPAAAWLLLSALAVLGWRGKKTDHDKSPAAAP